MPRRPPVTTASSSAARAAADLLVVLQTHSLGSAHVDDRYCAAPKREVTIRCANSLAQSLAAAQRALGIGARLVILDDRSDDDVLAALYYAVTHAGVEAKIERLIEPGLMPSIRACYERGRAEAKQLVYFAQDDYLHSRTAVEEMVEQYRLGSEKLGRPCAVHPFDDPHRYSPENNFEAVQLCLGKRRHWRRNYHTPSCFLLHRETLLSNWDLFDALASAPVGPTMEDDTINRLFTERGVTLFTPIPSLALHLQGETERDPYLDWKSWWEAARV